MRSKGDHKSLNFTLTMKLMHSVGQDVRQMFLNKFPKCFNKSLLIYRYIYTHTQIWLEPCAKPRNYLILQQPLKPNKDSLCSLGCSKMLFFPTVNMDSYILKEQCEDKASFI